MTTTFTSSSTKTGLASPELPIIIAFCLMGLVASAAIFLSQPLLAVEAFTF